MRSVLNDRRIQSVLERYARWSAFDSDDQPRPADMTAAVEAACRVRCWPDEGLEFVAILEDAMTWTKTIIDVGTVVAVIDYDLAIALAKAAESVPV